MIVRDEARRLPGCLDALAGLAGEIAVVDTGSADETLAIARSRGCVVQRFPWRNDFSAARNAALALCTGAWVLSLDADEIIAPEDHATLCGYTSGPPDRGYRFLTRNYTNDTSVRGYEAVDPGDPHSAGFSGWFPSSKVRLFPNLPGIAFEGVVHELLAHSLNRLGIAVVDAAVPIHHYPLLHQSASDRARKSALYLALGQAKVAAHPSDPKARHELGDQYVDLGDYAQALAAYREAVRLDPGNALWLKDLGSILLLLEQMPPAIQALQLSTRIDPDDAECWRNLGVGHARQSDWESARHAFEQAMALSPEHPETQRYLAMALEACGDAEGAIALLERTLRRWPHHEAASAQYLQLMEALGRSDEGNAWLAGVRAP